MNIVYVDADLLLHRAAWANSDNVEWEPGVVSIDEDLDAAQVQFDLNLTEVLSGVEYACYALAFSSGLNFRKRLNPSYKANRDRTKRPGIMTALKDWAMNEYPSLMMKGLEADDILGISGTQHKDIVMASFDKDMLTVPGLHYNWRKPELGVFRVGEREADLKFLEQCITGDSTDGYYGIKGLGPKKAQKILAGATDFNDGLWRVAQAYACRGYSYDYMLTQMRMARILRSTDWDRTNHQPILFDPNL